MGVIALRFPFVNRFLEALSRSLIKPYIPLPEGKGLYGSPR